jgi:hypothetical protein
VLDEPVSFRGGRDLWNLGSAASETEGAIQRQVLPEGNCVNTQKGKVTTFGVTLGHAKRLLLQV